MCDKFLKPEIVEDVVLGKERRNYKIKQKFDEGAKDLDILKEGVPVWIQEQVGSVSKGWFLGKCIKPLGERK